MTSSRRRSGWTSPDSVAATGSSTTTSVCPPTSKTYSIGNAGGFSGRPMSADHPRETSPAVPSSRSQYGWLGGVEAGRTWEASTDDRLVRVQLDGPWCLRAGYSGTAPPSSERECARARRRCDASSSVSPGTTSGWSTTVSTSRPRQAWMMPIELLRACRSRRGPRATRRPGGGSPAARARWPPGSSALNCAIASLGQAPISAPPGTRLHVVSTPSRRSFVAGSPPSGTNGLDPRPLGHHERAPTPKPCVLCMARLRAAIEANDSPDTGSSPPTSSFTTPISPPRGEPPAPAAAARPTLWRMRCGCHGVELAELLGKRLGVAGELEGFDGEDGGCGVMAVRGARLRREPRHDHVRTELADHADDVGEDGLPVPDPQRLLGSPSRTRSLSRA